MNCKIFVINLKRDVEKKKNMKSLLENLNYEIIEAVDGKTLNNNDFIINKNFFTPYDKSTLKLGEVGCSLSHLKIWKKIVNENLDKAIILEDDIQNICDFNILNNIKSDYDLLYLIRKKVNNCDEKIIEKLSNLDIVEPSFSYWTSGYVLTFDGAKKLLSTNFENNLIAVDEYLPIMCGCNHFNDYLNFIANRDYSGEKLKALAFKDNIIKLIPNTSQSSTTFHSDYVQQFDEDITVITVATDYNDSCKRYKESCIRYGVNPVILGLGEKWKGGDMAKGPGGGQKVNYLKKYLENVKENKLIIFTDSYDVMMNNNINILKENYKQFNKKVVFASEKFCWPDASLSHYFKNDKYENKYLNSGLFIGYTDDIKKILDNDIFDYEDDQLYYTKSFLKYKELNFVELDYENKLFFCLSGQETKCDLNYSANCITIDNIRPNFLHGNGGESTKIYFNNLITNTCFGFNSTYGIVKKDNFNNCKIIAVIEELEENNIKEELLNEIINQTYKVSKVIVYKINNQELKLNKIDKNIVIINKSKEFWVDINKYLENEEYDKIFYIKSNINNLDKDTLLDLNNENLKCVAPLIIRPNSIFSNFWGDVTNKGYYKRSQNYLDIVERKTIGVFNVPYISSCLLLDKLYIDDKWTSSNLFEDKDIELCYQIRKSNNFMHLINKKIYANFKDSDNFGLLDYNNSNWELKYINKDFKVEELKYDVNKLYLFTNDFCKEVIEIAEINNLWSKGGESYYDPRIKNIEPYPTKDIQLKDLKLEDMWQFIMDKYIKPFVKEKFNYNTKETNINFIVKYSLDKEGQRKLDPHHDSSTYTINVCLNDDFEGGGCRFVRQNYDICNKDIGSLILHPGKLTHYHQGLEISKGTRYLLVSFVN